MRILSLNCGSSSIKAVIYDTVTHQNLGEANIERITEQGGQAVFNDGTVMNLLARGHEASLSQMLPRLLEKAGVKPEAVGHRVTHGGPGYDAPVIIDKDVVRTIDALTVLAPIHNPTNLAGIRAAQRLLPDVPHVAVFDTSFHTSLPPRAKAYGIPKDLANKHGIRRYGFHGISHQYVAQQAALWLKTDISQLRLISCHLGSGASITAVEFGRSVETSMGMTPIEGLLMATRSGDVDPGALLYLMQKENLTAEAAHKLLNYDSGLKGMSGLSGDVRDLEQAAATGNEDARMALRVFCHRARKYIGAYAAVMGGVDAIIFTAGIGENSIGIREQIAQRFDYLGAVFDTERNREAVATAEHPILEISAETSRCKLLAIHTDEQWSIAEQTAKLILFKHRVTDHIAIPVAVSAHHVHLTRATIDILFGEGYQLTPLKPLSQPGQYASVESVTVVGPKNQLANMRILGPERMADQVEISRTDEFFLGIDAPVRESGNLKGTPGATLIGPKGQVTIPEGVIVAWRHIHMSPQDAEALGVHNGDLVEVEIESAERPTIFGNVVVRVSDKFRLEMHIDTDEANAAEVNNADHLTGELIDDLHETIYGARLRRRNLQRNTPKP